MTGFTYLLGGPAFSEFQRQKLAGDLRRRAGREFLFTAQFIYFIESPHDLSQDQLGRLEALLQAESAEHPDEFSGPVLRSTPDDPVLLVVPRLGTQSPWSTKATDIAHLCGLDTINRIERGTLFHLPPEVFEGRLITTIRPLVHYRMTQTVLDDMEAAKALF